MNCGQARDRLPDLIYGHLSAQDGQELQAHLGACAACRREETALRQVYGLLASWTPPAIAVDLPALYRQVAEGQRRRARRWRRVAIALGAAAAMTMFALMTRFEIRLEKHQVSLRWADAPAAPAPAPAPGPLVKGAEAERAELPPPFHATEQLEVLGELVQGQQEEIANLQGRLNELQRQVAAGNQRWLTTERDVAALSGQPISPR